METGILHGLNFMIHAGTAAGIAKVGQSGIAAELGLQTLLVPTLCSSFIVDSGTAQGIGGDLAKISVLTGTDGATIAV